MLFKHILNDDFYSKNLTGEHKKQFEIFLNISKNISIEHVIDYASFSLAIAFLPIKTNNKEAEFTFEWFWSQLDKLNFSDLLIDLRE